MNLIKRRVVRSAIGEMTLRQVFHADAQKSMGHGGLLAGPDASRSPVLYQLHHTTPAQISQKFH
jgi:hypothetical protein